MTASHPPAAEPPLPPPSTRALLVTVLGELTYPDDESVWTAALVRVLAGLGVESHAARQAIARASAAGWIDSERCGRAVRWRLTAQGRDLVRGGLRRTAEYLAEPTSWDGRWLILLVTIPQGARTERRRLYGGLNWLRMGNPTPGVWLTPHVQDAAELRALVARFGLTDAAIAFTGRTEDVGLTNADIVARSWNLAELADRYRALLGWYGQDGPGAEPSEPDVLVRYLTMRNVLQRFLRLDPQLPPELLPDWIGRDGAALFHARSTAWAAPARRRWEQLLAECEP